MYVDFCMQAIEELELPRNYLFVLKGKIIAMADEETTLARICLPTLYVRDTDAPSPASRTKLDQLVPQITTEKMSGSEPSFVQPSAGKKDAGTLYANFLF